MHGTCRVSVQGFALSLPRVLARLSGGTEGNSLEATWRSRLFSRYTPLAVLACLHHCSTFFTFDFMFYLRGGVYVIKEWHVTKQANTSGNFVQIDGRQEGLIAWLLALVKIDPTIHLSVSQRNFTLEARTFWGFSKRVIPLTKVSEVRTGFAYPWLGPAILAISALLCFFVSLNMLYNNEGVLGFLFMVVLTVVFSGSAVFVYI